MGKPVDNDKPPVASKGLRLRVTNRHGGEDKLRSKKLETELREVEQAEAKLFEAIEKGVVELDDRLKGRVQQHKVRRESAKFFGVIIRSVFWTVYNADKHANESFFRNTVA